MTITREQRELLRTAAHSYINSGVSIIPVHEKFPNFPVLPQVFDDNKNKMIGVWKDFRFRFATHEEVDRWIDDRRTTGIAGVCGTQSGNLLCIDFDDRMWLEKWTKKVSTEDLNKLPWSITARGAHLWVRCPTPGGNQKLAMIEDKTVKGGYKGVIETRGEGGYALLPPSLHPSGKIYRWQYGDPYNLPVVDMGLIKYWFEAASALSPIRTSIQIGNRHRDSFREHTPAGEIIYEFNRKMGRDYIEKCLLRNGYRPRGSGFIRPGGSDTTVYVRDDERDYAVSWHHNSSDDLHGYPRAAFDHFIYSEYSKKFDGASERAPEGSIRRAAEMIGWEYNDPNEKVMPHGPASGQMVDMTSYGDETVILTDSMEAGEILSDNGVSAIVGPHEIWPREWIRKTREFKNRFVCWTMLDRFAEMTAYQLDALIAEPLPPLPEFFTKRNGSLIELKGYLRNARQPIW